MKGLTYPGSPICNSTLGHLGWVDSDEDGPVDALDPNYGWWSSIFPVSPGDLVRIYTLSGDFVKTISCSHDKVDPQSPVGYVIWDCLNNSGYPAAPGYYLATVNDGGGRTIYTAAANPTVKPRITNVGFTGDVLTYHLDDSFAYVRCFLYDQGTGRLVGRPVWDRMRTAGQTYSAVVDTSLLTGPAVARFYAWRPDGGASDVTEFRVRVSKRGDINLNGIVGEVGDAVLFAKYFIQGDAVWDSVDRIIQVAATDVNGDNVTKTLADHVCLVRVVTGDAEIATRPATIAPSCALNWRIEDDSILVDMSGNTDLGALLLEFTHSTGGLGKPISSQRIPTLNMLWHDDGKKQRVFAFGMDRGARIPSGRGQILAIPIDGSAGSVDLARVEAVDYWGNPISCDTTRSAGQTPNPTLLQNSPNPFNASTTIRFSLAEPGRLTLAIHNVLGQHLVTLVDGSVTRGVHEVTWNGTDDRGQPVPSGVYVYSIRTADAVLSRKMVVIK